MLCTRPAIDGPNLMQNKIEALIAKVYLVSMVDRRIVP